MTNIGFFLIGVLVIILGMFAIITTNDMKVDIELRLLTYAFPLIGTIIMFRSILEVSHYLMKILILGVCSLLISSIALYIYKFLRE